jgi:hypothetical protein
MKTILKGSYHKDSEWTGNENDVTLCETSSNKRNSHVSKKDILADVNTRIEMARLQG